MEYNGYNVQVDVDYASDKWGHRRGENYYYYEGSITNYKRKRAKKVSSLVNGFQKFIDEKIAIEKNKEECMKKEKESAHNLAEELTKDLGVDVVASDEYKTHFSHGRTRSQGYYVRVYKAIIGKEMNYMKKLEDKTIKVNKAEDKYVVAGLSGLSKNQAKKIIDIIKE